MTGKSPFEFLPPLCAPSHLYAAFLLVTYLKAQTSCHLSFVNRHPSKIYCGTLSISFIILMRQQVNWGTVCLAVPLPPPHQRRSPRAVWQRLVNCLWPAGEKKKKKCFVAAAYCWCCLISRVSYLRCRQGAAVALTSWEAAWFGQLSASLAPPALPSILLFISISATLFNHSHLNKSGSSLTVE